MTIISAEKDTEALTLTISSEFQAPIARVWQMWENPRTLEKWWGPPSYPATVVDYDLTPGGMVSYFMTGPEGDQPHGWWRILSVSAPHALEFENGFADANGLPNDDMPVMIIRVALVEEPAGTTRMTIETRFSSIEHMEKIMSMGMEEGMSLAISQIDGLL